MVEFCETTVRKKVWTATELLSQDFPPVQWVIEGLIAPGLTLLAGAPKLGKSWLSLQIATAASVGSAALGKISVPQREVLYLALEDTPRRLKSRLETIGASASDRLHLTTEWERGVRGIESLREWIQSHPDTKLIIVDTWGRFSAARDGNDYRQVTDAANQLKAVADDFDIAILAVHHARKTSKGDDAGDFIDAVLGSTGLAAAADTTLLLRRDRGNRDAVLLVTGRDVPEAEYALSFDSDTGTWMLLGTTKEVQKSNARQQIVDLLTEADGAMTPKAIAEALGKNASTTRVLLRRMDDEGVVASRSGNYTLATRKHCKPVNSGQRETPENSFKFTEFTVSEVSSGNNGNDP